MNDALARVLAAAGLDADALGRDWARVVMVQNNGPVPASPVSLTHAHGVTRESRGFNLLILDRDGRPAHFCKCRVAGDGPLAHEARMLALLGADATLRDAVPQATHAETETLAVLATRYARGTPFSHIAARASDRDWLVAVNAILDLTEQLGACVAAQQDSRVAAPARDVALRDALGVLGTAGVAQHDLARLERAMADVHGVPPRPQHGDLWPANVLRDGDRWRVLDFEVFGDVCVPLFDAVHLVRTSAELRPNGPGEGGAWHEWLFGAETAAAVAARALLRQRATRYGLTSREATGALVVYVVVFAARALTHAQWGSTPAQWPREAARVAAMLERSEEHGMLRTP